jgi:hypothetical protein
MARYIDADELTEMLNKKAQTDLEMGLYNHGTLTQSFIRFVERQPTADVAPRAEWISVRERLPDGNGVFLVSLKESGYENLVYFDVRSYADGEWRNIPDKFTVSHWMPLPEPPEPPKESKR